VSQELCKLEQKIKRLEEELAALKETRPEDVEKH
jgi:hypothetical protein